MSNALKGEMMDNGVEELVEWVATKLYEGHHPRIFTTFGELKKNYHGSAEAIRGEAKQILSHPDLALIHKRKPTLRGFLRLLFLGERETFVIPLADALKEK